MKFRDILYGEIDLPDWIIPFIHMPEFVRLRGVRLSNVDSIQFKDFNGPTRWEHCIAVSFLALKLCQFKKLKFEDTVHLTLAALLHDIATPPFAHTIEYILDNFDHELESNRLLSSVKTDNSSPDTPVFRAQLPQFNDLCKKTGKKLNIKIDSAKVASLVTGEGQYGYYINGTMDLDNIDNVIRASLHCGLNVDRQLGLKLVEWLSIQESIPLNLKECKNAYVKQWVGYKNALYKTFFTSSDEELGRQAFLQHLIRRAYKSGLSRSAIIWNTDDGLLSTIESFSQKEETRITYQSLPTLHELVQRYKLLEELFCICRIYIEDEEVARAAKNPLFTSWLEEYLTTEYFEPFIITSIKRYSSAENSLFSPPKAEVILYKLAENYLKKDQLPSWLQGEIKGVPSGKALSNKIGQVLRNKLIEWANTKPWLQYDTKREDDIITSLESAGDWSFRLTRNQSIHSYPATFVHAIPAHIIKSLGVKGELVLDPFGGTGQTATEAIKLGCDTVTSDINSVASLTTRTKLSFITAEDRHFLRSLKPLDIYSVTAFEIPSFQDINKWHHKNTLLELSQIRQFINSCSNETVQNFLYTCFSNILTSCTSRRGKEHGFFADNTPLPKGIGSPEYQNATSLFFDRIKKNLDFIELFYAQFERNGLDVQSELSKAKIMEVDATGNPEEYGLKFGSVSAIVTSPPYLCMADYTLGTRLSYYWLFPENLKRDFSKELGARRGRTNPVLAHKKYLEGIQRFASNAKLLLKKDGFLACVIGTPVATAFKEKNIFFEIDEIFEAEGFLPIWSKMRQIYWHRNHGYARLSSERISVHIKQ